MAWFSRRRKDSAADPIAPTSAPPSPDEAWIAPSFDAYPISQGNVLVVPQPNGPPTRVDTALADTAHACQGALPWAKHRAQQAEQEGYEDLAGDGLEEREALVQAGLLRPLSQIRSQLGEGQPTTTGVSLKIACLLSCNRPRAVQRAWKTLDEHLRTFCREDTDIIVAHDSNKERLDEVLQALKPEPGFSPCARLRHFLPEGRRDLAEFLIQATGAPRDIVEWGLVLGETAGIGPGGPINALFLLGAGNPLLFSDDDMVFHFHQQPESQKLLRLKGDGGADHYRFSNETWDAFTGDYLAEHERWLGRPAGELLRAGVTAGPMEELTARLLARLDRPEAHVALTTAGYAGDPGFGSPIAYLTLPETQARGFFQDPLVYQSALNERKHLRAAPSPVVTGGHLVLSGAMAVDARSLVPAFIPNDRGSDNCFATHLLATDPGALFAALPVAVGHEPEQTRRDFPRIWEETWPQGHVWLSHFEPLRWIWTDFCRHSTGSTVRSRMHSIARQWEAAGTEDPKDHLKRVRVIGLVELHQWAVIIDKCHSKATHPAHRLDLELMLRRTDEMARDAWFFLPGGKASSPGFVERQQALCRRFGAFLNIWPDLWDTAQSLPAEERLERFAHL